MPKFQSDVIKNLLPAGINASEEITREEALGVMANLKNWPKNGNYMTMFIGHCLGEFETWGVEIISTRLTQIEHDCLLLRAKLIVEKKTDA